MNVKVEVGVMQANACFNADLNLYIHLGYPYATVIRTIPVLSHVIVKLPLVEDWSEPKST